MATGTPFISRIRCGLVCTGMSRIPKFLTSFATSGSQTGGRPMIGPCSLVIVHRGVTRTEYGESTSRSRDARTGGTTPRWNRSRKVSA